MDVILLSFNDSVSFLSQIANMPPDVCFLDTVVDNGVTQGIQIAELIRQRVPACRIIFLSNSLQYVTASFHVQPTYYILKSELQLWLGDALSIALRNPSMSDRLTISITSNRKHLILPQSSIRYLEHSERKTKIICTNGTYYVRERIPSLVLRLTNTFCQCHASFAVNLSHVQSLQRQHFLLNDCTQIPIGRTHLPSVKSQFNYFLSNQRSSG